MQRAGDRDLVHDQRATLGVACALQHRHGGLAARVVRVVGVVGPGQQHFARADEAAEVVDVAVGFVVEQAVGQPDDAVDRQVLAQDRLDLLAGQLRVAVAVEQALLGGDQRAFAVDVDRAALEHETFGAIAIAVLDLEDLARHLVVALPVGVEPAVFATPGIEGPVDAAQAAVVVDDEGRPGVTHPGVVAAHFHHADARVIQCGARRQVLLGAGADGHRLETGDRLGDGGEGRLRRRRVVPPVVRALRPDHPGLAVRRPFGGHVVTILARGAGQGGHGDVREGWKRPRAFPPPKSNGGKCGALSSYEGLLLTRTAASRRGF